MLQRKGDLSLECLKKGKTSELQVQWQLSFLFYNKLVIKMDKKLIDPLKLGMN